LWEDPCYISHLVKMDIKDMDIKDMDMDMDMDMDIKKWILKFYSC